MKQRITPVGITCFVVFTLGVAVVLFFQLSDRAQPSTKPPTALPLVVKSTDRPLAVTPRIAGSLDSQNGRVSFESSDLDESETDVPGARWKTAHIEEIKEALYELDVESVEDLHHLDQFVQIGDADTRDFWNTDWAGVDDWKRDRDGFRLEKLDDGTLIFSPGEATRQIYSFFETNNVYEYDDVTQEFVHEVNYYGKPIINIVKFLREDVMVMMVVSGQKVDMNIYELNDEPRD